MRKNKWASVIGWEGEKLDSETGAWFVVGAMLNDYNCDTVEERRTWMLNEYEARVRGEWAPHRNMRLLRAA